MRAALEEAREEGSLEAEFGCAAAEVIRAGSGTRLRLPLAWMAGEATECLFPGLRDLGEAHGFSLHETGDLLLGCAVEPARGALAPAAQGLYRRMFAATAGHLLYRVWNYVPAINARPDGRENYHAFCAGRSQAFEARYGPGFKRELPAASGVGCGGESLAVLFVAGRAPPRHVENPEQVSAYNYPREHGEKPPSFARATVASREGRPLVFLSGTAAIKGHMTVAPHSVGGQLDCMLDNLAIIGRAAGLGGSIGADSGMARHFKVYVRNSADLDSVRRRLESDLLRPEDRVIYLRADICRAALSVEVEATLVG